MTELSNSLPSEESRKAAVYLLHLMGCALNGTKAESKPVDISWELVYKLAARNSVQGLAWFGAETCDDVPNDLRATWKASADRVLYRHAMFGIERESILKDMAARGLSYLPLKGLLLVNYYPRPEMRSMCDNDILYGYVEPDPQGGYRIQGATEREREKIIYQATKELNDIMLAREYSIRSEHSGNHETYLKKPFYNFEMHRKLISISSSLYAYYENPWKRAIRDELDPFAYRFSDEDEYVYVIAHAFKHFDVAGCGIRILADIYAFMEAKGRGLDWAYVQKQFEALGISDFERQMRELALVGLNGGANLTDAQLELLWYMVGSGTYGTDSQRIANNIKKNIDAKGGGATSKARYLWRRIVGGKGFIEEHFPVFHKHKILLPFYPFYRVFWIATRNRGGKLKEIKMLFGGNDQV